MANGRAVATAMTAVALVLSEVTRAAAQEPGSLTELPDFAIEGEIRHESGRWRAEQFFARIGDLPLTGNLVVDLAGETRSIEGFLRLPDFDHEAARALLDDLGFEPPEDDDDRLVPALDLRTGWLDGLALDLDVEIDGVQGFYDQVDRAIAHVGARDRRLAVRGLQVTVGSGDIEGEAILDAREATPSIALALDLRAVDMEPFIEDTNLAGNIAGIVHGRLDLVGRGATLDQVFATAEGEISVVLERGWVGALAIQMAGMDVFRALPLFLGEDEHIALNCGRIDLAVTDGIAEVTRLLIDTTDAVVVGGGTIDLGNERLDLAIDARQKDFTLLEASRQMLIGGSFTDIEIEATDIEGLDFFQPGDAEPLDCHRLIGIDFWDLPE